MNIESNMLLAMFGEEVVKVRMLDNQSQQLVSKIKELENQVKQLTDELALTKKCLETSTIVPEDQ
jgi:hypothetical protein